MRRREREREKPLKRHLAGARYLTAE